jgi:hypothetical protein
MIGRHLRIAVGAEHAQLTAGPGVRACLEECWKADERCQQLERVAPRPLQVVEHQQRAPRPGHVPQEASHGREHQTALLLRCERPRWERFNWRAG